MHVFQLFQLAQFLTLCKHNNAKDCKNTGVRLSILVTITVLDQLTDTGPAIWTKAAIYFQASAVAKYQNRSKLT